MISIVAMIAVVIVAMVEIVEDSLIEEEEVCL